MNFVNHFILIPPVPAVLPFVSTWDTSKISTGSSTAAQVKLPIISSGTYNFTVNWGDGNSDTITTWNAAATTHTYSSAGTKTITISGVCTGWRFANTGDRLKFMSVSSWGTLKLGNLNGYFQGCSNLTLTAVSDILDFTGVTTCNVMFHTCTALTTVNNMNSWDVSNITDMESMFFQATNFNQNIGGWNTGNVLYTDYMFYQARAFNQNIGGWNMTKATNIFNMFAHANAFNNGGNSSIGGWTLNTISNINASNLFENAWAFNQDISGWNTIKITNSSGMFKGATAFNQNIGSWNMTNVTNMANMFIGAAAFNQNIGSWNVTKATNFGNMFNGATAFNNGGNSSIGGWTLNTTSNVDCISMFQDATVFNQPLGWNTVKVISMELMFKGATAFNQNIGSWNTIAVTNFRNMFQNAVNFNQNIGSWNTIAALYIDNMFNGATAFNQDLSSWNVSNVTGFTNFMTSKTAATFSATNLDAIYNGWSSRPVLSGKTISFGTAKYTAASSAGRGILTGAPNNWTIADGGI